MERRHKLDELKALPPMGRSTEQWQSLSRDAERKARQRDQNFLTKIFESRSWRPDDVADVLLKCGYLGDIFDDSEAMWPMKMQFLRDTVAKLYEETWKQRAPSAAHEDRPVAFEAQPRALAAPACVRLPTRYRYV